MSTFSLLQKRVVSRLAADVFFTPPAPRKSIVVLDEQIGDIVNRISKQIGSIGILALVVTPTGRKIDGSKRIIDLEVPLIVQIQEDVVINQASTGTRWPALDVVVRTMQLLHWWNPGLTAGSYRMARLQLADVPFELVTQEPLLTYNVNFVTTLIIPSESERLASDPDGALLVNAEGTGYLRPDTGPETKHVLTNPTGNSLQSDGTAPADLGLD